MGIGQISKNLRTSLYLMPRECTYFRPNPSCWTVPLRHFVISWIEKRKFAEIYFPTFPKSKAETAGNALNRRKTYERILETHFSDDQ
jgi:hypothetical protein